MRPDPSRRQLLVAGGLGVAALAVGGVGTWRSLADPTSSAPLAQPSVLASRDGILDVSLDARPGVTLAGRATRGFGYNGGSPGPTLRVRPGDLLRVSLHNGLDRPTNLHTHGLHVSPEGRSDNVFRMVGPDETADYEYRLPPDHPAGTFWYHPHHHGTVADQVFAGLFGALVVTGSDEPVVDTERVLVVSDTTLAGDGSVVGASHMDAMLGREGDLVLVNGQREPVLAPAAGTTERWRVVNACTSRFLDLRLDGQAWRLLGYDGQALHAPEERDTLLLTPGNRVDVLVTVPSSGSSTLRSLAYDRGGMGMMGGARTSGEVVLARLDPTPAAATHAAPWSGPRRPRPDLRAADVDRRRTIAMTGGMGMGMGMTEFGFDGRPFDAGRVDQRLRLGTVEEWTITNTTTMDHPFHLHVWPMQLMDDAGPSGPAQWRDVVLVPARGSVTVRVAVRDVPGRTVYHCHILDHEDLGMMGVVEAA